MAFSAKRIMSGTWGELWLDGELVAECYKFQAKDAYTRESVTQCGTLRQGKKLTQIEGTGTVGLRKVRSLMAQKIGTITAAGNDPRFTLISKVDDPDAYGAERIAFYGVAFDDMTWADWEAGVMGNVECPFTYEGCEPLTLVEGGVN